MRHIILAVGICLAFTIEANAQSTPTNDLEIIQSIFGKSKKQLVENYMGLSGDAANNFWSVYDVFETKRRELVKDRLVTLAQYIDGYLTLTDDSAAKIANQAFKNEKNLACLHKKYFKKMKKAVGGLNAAKFMQMEDYLQKTVELEVLDDIPFIGEIKELKKM